MKRSKQLNILYSHRTRGRDVEGIHIKGISDAFVQLGHKVIFLALPGAQVNRNKKKYKKNQRERSYWNIVSKYCPQLLFELLELLYNFLLYVRLFCKIKEQHFDFIYERYALNTFATVLLGKRNNIPVILEVNDATGIPRVRRHKAEFIARNIESWVFENCTAIVTISSEFQRIIEKKVTDKKKITFVPNAVDPSVFDPDVYEDYVRTKIGHDKIIIGFVGSFAFWHGVELLVEVMQDIVKAVPNVHFLLVGSGDRLHDIRNDVYSKGLGRYVTFTGKITPEKVPLYLKAMDIGVIPNSNIYGSPVKMFEYMAMEVVTVAPNLPPIMDVIKDNKTGLIFKQNDAGMLKDRLIYLCVKNKIRIKMAQEARDQVLKKHLWVHNAEHVLDIFFQI